MVGFYFGGHFVLTGRMTAADLVTFVEEANRLVMDTRNFLRHFTGAVILSRFVVGLSLQGLPLVDGDDIV